MKYDWGSYKKPCRAHVSSIENHQPGSSLPEWNVSFVERCLHLLQKQPVASLVLSLTFVSQQMEFSEERGAVKDTDSDNITNEPTKNQHSQLKAAKLQYRLRVSNVDILQLKIQIT